MPGCAAIGCNNRSEKGYIMKCFPRDPTLRKLWQEKVARADWEPSNNSFLCHVHFEPQEWSITQTGRIKLKKNAIPTIFTVTSTRKSPKKRKKIINATETDKNYEDEDIIEFLEHDTEQSSIGNLEDKESDYEEIKESSMSSFVQQNAIKNNQSFEAYQMKDNVKRYTLYQNIGGNLTGDDIIIISDKNMTGINSFNNPNNLLIQTNTSTSILKQEPVNLGSEKAIIKHEEVQGNLLDDSYDEIEEKLKQICDGGPTGDEDINKKNNLILMSDKEARKNIPTLHNSNIHPIKNEIGHVLADKRKNVEIIFGTESGDEKSLPLSNNLVPAEVNKDERLESISPIKDVKKIEFMEDIEENFGKDKVHVIPSMKAAIKRKRRMRQEILRSIKKSIGSASDQDLNTFTNSDLSDNTTDKDTETGKNINLHKRRSCKDVASNDGMKFTIKVTGDPDDVTDVIEELSSKTTNRHDLEKFDIQSVGNGNNSFVTTVITIEDYPENLSNKESKETTDYEYLEKSAQYANSKSIEKSKYKQNSVSYSDEDSKSMDAYVSYKTQSAGSNIKRLVRNNNSNQISQDLEELQQRVKIQESVIGKLTDQLIVYKNLESNLRNKNTELQEKAKQVDTLTNKLNTHSSSLQHSAISGKKNLESKQRLIEDLSNRINYLEEINKKLMKTITLESQQKRNLEGQVKQRDNQIKELNWKLEKASKYLERAEKNTNTYRRKMLNMQTIMRRKKLLDEKMSRFNEIMMDGNKEEFSEKTLTTAVEIRKTCGRIGYNKLVSLGFPLPPLRSLQRKFVNDTYSDLNQSDTEFGQKTAESNKKETTEITSVRDSSIMDSEAKEVEYEGTVTGTVQDIFEENNDVDDFSTNELREHFILQLNTVV